MSHDAIRKALAGDSEGDFESACTWEAVRALLADRDALAAQGAARESVPISDSQIDKLADEHLNTARIEGFALTEPRYADWQHPISLEPAAPTPPDEASEA
jgi:hypothetical protein